MSNVSDAFTDGDILFNLARWPFAPLNFRYSHVNTEENCPLHDTIHALLSLMYSLRIGIPFALHCRNWCKTQASNLKQSDPILVIRSTVVLI